MPRALSSAYLTAIEGTLTLALFAELAFADNTLYVFTGTGKITPAGPPANPASTFPYGETFIGLGWMAKLSAIPSTTKVQAQNITLSLSGIPPSLVAEATGQVRIPGTATIWLGLFSAAGALLTDPVQLFAGAFDVPSLTDSGESSMISITCENPLLSLNLAPNRLFDDTDQQLYFPGDLGMSFVDALQNLELFWPAPDPASTPYPIYMTVSPAAVDIAVGASTTVSVTIHYSDGSTYTHPSGVGSGPSFVLAAASTNPQIAEWQYTGSNNVTGVSPGECSIIARVPIFNGSSGTAPTQQYRAACSIVVHS